MTFNRYFRRKNKFNNHSCRCSKGHIHQSRFEASYCDDLSVLEKAGEIKSYRTQVRYPLKINGQVICSHYVDFEVVDNQGNIKIHETKGMETEVWRIKRKLFEACYPDIEYITVRDAR